MLVRDPDRRGIVFDLEQVVWSAEAVMVKHGLAERVEIVAGDFFRAVPHADTYVLSAVLHDWDDESCLGILGAIRRSASPGARLVVVETVVPEGDEPHLSKETDMVMLAILTGKERTAKEYETLLGKVGFTLDRIVPTSSPFSFIEATLD